MRLIQYLFASAETVSYGINIILILYKASGISLDKGTGVLYTESTEKGQGGLL